jgi:nicotinamidase/pyrazinamidase
MFTAGSSVELREIKNFPFSDPAFADAASKAAKPACLGKAGSMPEMREIDMTQCNRRHFVHGLAAGLGAALLAPGRSAFAAGNIAVDDRSVLIVVDVQNCFLPGGSLAVKDGDQVAPVINLIAKKFAHVVLTQDWHMPGHVSFASAHPGKAPFDVIKLPYGDQVLWPDHCVQGTSGADISKEIAIPHAELVVRKGYNKGMDSYSAFLEADHATATGLAGYLKERGLARVFVAGLATDFCVAWTAIDARRLGFETFVIDDASRGIDNGGSLAAAWTAMQGAGVKRIRSDDLAA